MQQSLQQRIYRSGTTLPALQVVGVSCALLLVDTVGRRPLLLAGSGVTATAMLAIAAADYAGSWMLQLGAMCAFMLAFSISWAGIFWVLMSEIFSMTVKSPAAAAAVAAAFLTGSCLACGLFS